MCKSYDTASTNWVIFDDKQNTYNVSENYLLPNTNAAASTESNTILDFVSNGVKMRGDGTPINQGTYNYIYLAFAETPFKTANAR